MNTKTRSSHVTLVALLSIFAAACSTATSSPAPPTQPPPASEQTPPTTEPEKFTPTELPGPPEGPLSSGGPWWIFSTADGLFAVNPDGSGLMQFYTGPISQPYTRRILPAFSGGHIAFITGRDIFNVTLRVMRFPQRTTVAEVALTSDESEPGPDAMPGDSQVEAVRAMTETPSMAFSPDGRYLAFMGAIEGPTSDLYVFSLDTYETTQLTDGPSQGYQPVWSPDGKYIVHTGVSTFGTGAGYSMEGIWAARADNSGVITLYDISGSSAEEIIGWADNRTFVVHSWDAGCGPKNLRAFNIETKQITTLWPDYFHAIAFDPSNAVAVLGVRFPECNPDGRGGLFLVPANGMPSTPIVEDEAYQIIWSQEANLFLVSTEFGTLAVDSNGQYTNLDKPQNAAAFPAVAPGSRDLAWPGEALWVGPFLGSIDNPPAKVFHESTYNATWDPSGQYILFFGPSGLYVAQRPAYQPRLVAEGLDNRNGFSAWVVP